MKTAKMVRAVKIYYTMEKTLLQVVMGKLRVGCVLFVYGCTFCIAGGVLVECSFR
jgi:hypothetical protein